MTSKYHFFTDYDLLQPQNSSQAFGPAGNNGTHDEYRLLSLHNASGPVQAYAVSDGVVCAQFDTNNPNLINLVLKPFRQQSLNFIQVAYFIYKGIKADSILNMSHTELDYSSNIRMVQSIKESQDAFNISFDIANNNSPGTTVTVASASSLGLQYTATALSPDTVLDNTPIGHLFFKSSDFQLPIVQSGWSLGKFDENHFGIEIIVESFLPEPTVDRLRYFHGIGNVDTKKVVQLPSTPTQADAFSHLNVKESVLRFMDPAAFYGSLFNMTIHATNSLGSTNKMTGVQLYDSILTHFFNKNKVYIDVRNEHNHSIDYYNNYGKDIEMSLDNNANVISLNYYRSGWPILIVENSEFPSNLTSPAASLILNLPKGDNINPIYRLDSGFLFEGFPNNPKSDSKFIEIGNSNYSQFNDSMELGLANKPNSGLTGVVASYIKIILLRRTNPLYDQFFVQKEEQIIGSSVLELIPLFPIEPNWPIGNFAQSKTTMEAIFVDRFDQTNEIYMGQVGIAFDQNGDVTLYIFPVDKYYSTSFSRRIPLYLQTEKFESENNFLNAVSSKFDFLLHKSTVLENGIAKDGWMFIDQDIISEGTSDNENIFVKSSQDLFFARIISNDYVYLIGLASSTFLPDYRVYIKLSIVDSIKDVNNIFSFNKCEIELIGYVLDQISSKIIRQSIMTGIIIYLVPSTAGDLSNSSILN
ncbi:MAG TPA: hypothetical protein DIW47_05015 [Bacteroidetes bacterium]|nr:hypothetical protein [Bacteroidota bacterium]